MAFSLRLALALDHGEDGSADALSAAALSVPLSLSGTAKTRVEEGKMGKQGAGREVRLNSSFQARWGKLC